jgi:hypothetical protein
LVVLVENGRDSEVLLVVAAQYPAGILFTAVVAAAAALLLWQVQVAIHIMVAAAQVMFRQEQVTPQVRLDLQFTAAAQAVRLRRELVFLVLVEQVNLVVLVVRQCVLQRLHQEQFQQAVAVLHKLALHPARVQQVKFV